MFLPGPSPMPEEELKAYLENLQPLSPFIGLETQMAMLKGVHSNPLELIPNDDAWKQQSHEEYVTKLAIIAYAEAWGRLVEEAVADGHEFADAMERCATLANCNNITPPHFIAAAGYLSKFWMFRAYLTIWWNSQS